MSFPFDPWERHLFTLGVLTAISDAGQFKTAFEEAQAENVKLAGGATPAAAEEAPTTDAPAAEPETKAEEKTEEAAAEEKKEE